MRELQIVEILNLQGFEDVLEELHDPRYGNRQHGSRATAALECDGPLCKLADRDRSRRRNEIKAKKAGRDYQPRGRDYDRDDALYAIIAWHKLDLAIRRVRELSEGMAS